MGTGIVIIGAVVASLIVSKVPLNYWFGMDDEDLRVQKKTQTAATD